MTSTAFCILLSLVSTPEPQHIDADERPKAVLLVLTPNLQPTRTSASQILTSARDILERETDVILRSPEQEGVDSRELLACDDHFRLGCWHRQVSRTPKPPEVLIVVTLASASQTQDRISSFHLHLSPPPAGDGESVEAELLGRLRRLPARNITPDELHGFVSELSARIRQDGHLPAAQALVSGLSPGESLEVDNRLLGASTGHPILVTGLRSGSRIFSTPRDPPEQVTVVLTATTSAQVAFRLILPTHVSRPAVLVAAGTMLAVGTAFALYGLTLDARAACVRSDCEGPGFPRFGFDADEAPAVGGEIVNPSGPPIAAFAAPLVSAGILGLVSPWMGAPEDPPWLALGAATLSALLSIVAVVALDTR